MKINLIEKITLSIALLILIIALFLGINGMYRANDLTNVDLTHSTIYYIDKYGEMNILEFKNQGN